MLSISIKSSNMNKKSKSSMKQKIKTNNSSKTKSTNTRSYTSKSKTHFQKLPAIMTEIRLSGRASTLSWSSRKSPPNRRYRKLRRSLSRLCSTCRSIERMIRRTLSQVIMFWYIRWRRGINRNFMKKKKPTNSWLIN